MLKLVKREELFFLLIYGIWFMCQSLCRTQMGYKYDFNYIMNACVVILFLGGLIKLIKRHCRDIKIVTICIGFLLISGLVFYLSEDKLVLTTAVILVAAMGEDYRKIFIESAVIMMIAALVAYFGAYFGIYGKGARAIWGYTSITLPGYIWLFLSLMGLAIMKKPSIIYMIVTTLGQLFLFKKFENSATMIIAVFATICVILIRIIRPKNKIWGGLFTAVPILACAFSFVVHLMYDGNSQLWQKLDFMVNNRLRLGNEGIYNFGLPLFGQKIRWVGVIGVQKHPELTYNYVDCYFIKYMINYGIIYQLIVMAAICLSIYVAYKKKIYGLVVALIALMGLGVADAVVMNLILQPFMLILPWAITTFFSENNMEK